MVIGHPRGARGHVPTLPARRLGLGYLLLFLEAYTTMVEPSSTQRWLNHRCVLRLQEIWLAGYNLTPSYTVSLIYTGRLMTSHSTSHLFSK